MFSIIKGGFRWRAVLLALVLLVTPTAAFAINFTGRVGIGTTNPTDKFTVSGNPSGQWTASLRSGTSTGDAWGTSVRGGTNSSDTAFLVESASGATTYLKIRGDGNVGIGMSNPSNALHVNGNIGATGSVGAGCEINCESSGGYVILQPDGTIITSSGATLSGGTWNNASDLRLKTNIQSLDTSSMDSLLRLRPVTFEWKDTDQYAKGTQIGFIAQDVEEVYPSLVSTDKTTGIKSLNYAALVAPLVKAVQQLKAQVDDQAAKIEALRRTVPNPSGTSACLLNATIGSPQKPAGFTMYDIHDGRAHCVYLNGGNLISILGTCEQTDARIFRKSQ